MVYSLAAESGHILTILHWTRSSGGLCLLNKERYFSQLGKHHLQASLGTDSGERLPVGRDTAQGRCGRCGAVADSETEIQSREAPVATE